MRFNVNDSSPQPETRAARRAGPDERPLADPFHRESHSSRLPDTRVKCRILVIDGDLQAATAVAERLRAQGHECRAVCNLSHARLAMQSDLPDLVLLDTHLPDGDGFNLIATPHAGSSRVSVIALSARRDRESAFEAMRRGAIDCLAKPIDRDDLLLAVHKAQAVLQLRRRIDFAAQRDSLAIGDKELLGSCERLQFARQQLASLARSLTSSGSPKPVLLVGEPGTGKSVAARALHRGESSCQRPFVRLRCAEVPRGRLVTELFGSVAGNAGQGPPVGTIEAAEDGTVYIDEIGAFDLEQQGWLCDVLERRVVRRGDAGREFPVAARFVLASTCDLPRWVERGRFRADLLERLQDATVRLPPLRDRGQDIVLLARHFAVATAARRLQPGEVCLDDSALEALVRHPWPGNVRELKQLIERAVSMGSGQSLSAQDLGLAATDSPCRSAPSGVGRAIDHMTLDEAEHYMIERALHRTGGNVSEAARRLGVTRMALRYRIDKRKGANR